MKKAEAAARVMQAGNELRAYAEERGLVLRPEFGGLGPKPLDKQRGRFREGAWSLAGVMPGGVPGRLWHRANFGGAMRQAIGGQQTTLITRLPESVGFVPMLTVRPTGVAASALWAMADQRNRFDVGGFESLELDRRFVVEVAAGQDPNWLRQLFSPTFIDWLGDNTPDTFSFRLDKGILMCECPKPRDKDTLAGDFEPQTVDRLAEGGGRVAARIREEVLEEVRGGRGGRLREGSEVAVEAAAGAGTARFARELVARFAPEALDSGIPSFGTKHGMEPTTGPDFHAAHIGLPLPGTASDALAGPLPRSRVDGHIGWLDFGTQFDPPCSYVVATVDMEKPMTSLWVDANDPTVPSFGAELAPEAVALAKAHDYGIAAGMRKACVYIRSPSGTELPRIPEIEAMCERAPGIVAALPSA